jgi:hypothetical protein
MIAGSRNSSRRGKRKYLYFDFEFIAIARDAEFRAYVGDGVATTTVNAGRHHSPRIGEQ